MSARPTSREVQKKVHHRLGEKTVDGNRDLRAINLEIITEKIEESVERK